MEAAAAYVVQVSGRILASLHGVSPSLPSAAMNYNMAHFSPVFSTSVTTKGSGHY